MKKFFVFALAVLLVFAFTLPAAAVEHVFGGYWRTRFATQQDFTGEDTLQSRDVSLVDTRTRLYYTAVLHDNLKLVNKFEIDAVWGLNGGQGGGTVAGTNADADIGADGVGVEVKNSYADFNLGDWNFKVGYQGMKLARGLLFDADAAGVLATYHGDNFQLPLFWVKGFEGSGEGIIDDNEKDVDFYGLAPIFNINDVSVNPFFVWATSEDLSSWRPATNANDVNASANTSSVKDVDLYYLGVNLDYKADNFSVWGTFIYEAGECDIPTLAIAMGFGDATRPYNADIDAYLIAGGGSIDLNEIELHGQVVYATGDSTRDQEIDSYFVPGGGQSYYWSEIMGLGAMDNQASANAPGDKISNLIMFNVGTTFSPMDKLTVKLDLWNANKEEDDTNGEDHLGTEIDVRLTYNLLEGLNADLIGAYLFRGNATYLEGPGINDEADPWELAFQLSLSF
jgi:hypothetical protein